MNEQAARELPQYKCHKLVWALKIAKIDYSGCKFDGRTPDYTAIITPAEPGYAPFQVDEEYIRTYNPQVGGYYIVSGAGYKGYAPGKEFEDDFLPIK